MPEETLPTVATPPNSKSFKTKKVALRVIIITVVLLILGLASLYVLNLHILTNQITTTTNLTEPSKFFKPRPPLTIKVNKIAFLRDDQVWLTNPDGSGQEQITKEKRFWQIVGWSPDGSKLVLSGVVDKFVGVERLPDGCDSYYSCAGNDLFYYNLAEKAVKRLTTVPEGSSIYTQSWAPDSERYVYVLNNNNENNNAFVIGNTQTGKQNTTTFKAGHLRSEVSWAPNGEKILFLTNYGSDGNNIYVILNSKGELLEKVDASSTTLVDFRLNSVEWGRDDTQLISSVSKWYPPPSGNYESDGRIYNMLLLNNKLKSIKQIARQKGVNLGFSGVKVSPNKNYIGAISSLNSKDYGSNVQLSIFDINGNLIKESITKEVGTSLRSFTWSPQEDKVAVSTTLGEVFTVTFNEKANKILDKATDPQWSPL